ncbi:hypothetical protein QAD02_021671 [Eretmocerus hayati]|uniref:Uncharacterized protein n=1 Tax=Eretmocerus hayati TaxID=131215 RepID=A0ACC2PRY9_9HYME|nr:hypothetical protein QAD02_021671 [Eretmocerus hayati]
MTHFKKCCVPFCDSCKPGLPRLILHSFPKDQKVRELWLKNLGLPTDTNHRCVYVCSSHFQPGDYIKQGNRLKDSTVPSLIVKEYCNATGIKSQNTVGKDVRHHPSILRPKKKNNASTSLPCSAVGGKVDAHSHAVEIQHQQVRDVTNTQSADPSACTRNANVLGGIRKNDQDTIQYDETTRNESEELNNSSEVDENILPANCSDCELLELQNFSVGSEVDNIHVDPPIDGTVMESDAQVNIDNQVNVNQPVVNAEPLVQHQSSMHDEPRICREPVLDEEPVRPNPPKFTILSMLRCDEDVIAYTGVNFSILRGLEEAVNLCILQKLDPTIDAVMVDKGFSIETECLESHIELIIPPKLGNERQMPRDEVLRTNKIAAARVHVERTIQRFKVWDVVSSKIQWILIPYIDDIFTIVAGLVNHQNPILSDNRYEKN